VRVRVVDEIDLSHAGLILPSYSSLGIKSTGQ